MFLKETEQTATDDLIDIFCHLENAESVLELISSELDILRNTKKLSFEEEESAHQMTNIIFSIKSVQESMMTELEMIDKLLDKLKKAEIEKKK